MKEDVMEVRGSGLVVRAGAILVVALGCARSAVTKPSPDEMEVVRAWLYYGGLLADPSSLEGKDGETQTKSNTEGFRVQIRQYLNKITQVPISPEAGAEIRQARGKAIEALGVEQDFALEMKSKIESCRLVYPLSRESVTTSKKKLDVDMIIGMLIDQTSLQGTLPARPYVNTGSVCEATIVQSPDVQYPEARLSVDVLLSNGSAEVKRSDVQQSVRIKHSLRFVKEESTPGGRWTIASVSQVKCEN